MPLRPYQEATVEKILSRGGRGLIANDVGTGKTFTALEIARRLDAKKILVVCPISVAPVWEREVALREPDFTFVDASLGTIAQRAQRIREHAKVSPLVVAVGYESYWRKPLSDVLLTWNPDIVIYDEAHRLKSRGSRQAKFAHKLADRIRHRIALTATPMPKGPEDLFSIYKAVDSTVFGKTWGDFEDRYLKISTWGGYPRITGYRDLDDIERKVQETASRVRKEDALDLPEEVDVVIPVTLSQKSRDIYRELNKRAIAEIEGLHGETGVALSRVVVTNLLRLQQVTSGFVKVTDGREIEFGTEKLDVFEDLISDLLPRHIVVFCVFRRDVARVAEIATKYAPTYQLHGDIAPHARRRAIERFRAGKSGIMVCQIQVASLGIDLTCADVSVFFGVNYDLMNYTQARGRLHRHGQVNRVTHYMLLARNTIDERIYRALDAKEQLTRDVLDPTD